MSRKTLDNIFKACHVLFALMFIAGLFFMVGFIGNVDYCTEMGIESEIGFPQLFGSALLMLAGFAGYKITTHIQEGVR